MFVVMPRYDRAAFTASRSNFISPFFRSASTSTVSPGSTVAVRHSSGCETAAADDARTWQTDKPQNLKRAPPYPLR